MFHSQDACIIHSKESVKHDLMAARRIGKGVAVGASSLHSMYPDISERKIRKDLKAVHPHDYPDIIHRYGIGTVLYQIIWDLNYHIGKGI